MDDKKKENEDILELFEKSRSNLQETEQKENRAKGVKPLRIFNLKRKSSKKRRKLRLSFIIFISLCVLLTFILFAVKCCSGNGDILKGTWDLDGVTVYRFDGNGQGSLILPGNTYPFTYEIKEDRVSIDFESAAARDADYTFSVKEGVLTMTGGEGSVEPGRVYELTRQE